MRKIPVFSWSLLVITGLIACKGEAKKTEAPAARNSTIIAEGFVAKSLGVDEKLDAPGTILPYEQTDVMSEISGRVVAINIPEGGQVKKGQVLVKLFDEDLQAQLKKLQVQLSIAEQTASRQKELLTISGVSQQEYDLSELDVNNLKADIDLVNVNIRRTEVRAPYDGRMGLRNISPGAYITPTTLITTISQVNQLKLEFSIPEKYSNHIRIGKNIEFYVAGNVKPYQAKVIATETTIETNTRTLKVRATITGHDQHLSPGAFARVNLAFADQDVQLVVPTQAIIPQARDKQVIVYRDGKGVPTTVTTGIRDASYVQILSGILPGDTIIVTSLMTIRPNSKIELSKVD
ncbi:efflux RND transporter periplasmic adaptor subunit [Gynurincola endophyticus]|jgi:membrane fusion protein (multidrug efflux system)|uniref:efflux RND transporter periplasmic adaptor subunit n=1 Tax=Gynurincola endophyticus TaxID=2479004 RepID=UPI000F8EEA90|nr:efflux RND transporter periplasmic adaptor subunit [Gynurincola endophyticus]